MKFYKIPILWLINVKRNLKSAFESHAIYWRMKIALQNKHGVHNLDLQAYGHPSRNHRLS